MTPIVSELFLRTQPDERLVRLARGGHDQAFAVIVSRYQRELLAFARRSGPEARAEDVVQQALLSALVALRRGTEITHLRGWLYTIVRNGLARAAAGAPVLDVDADGVALTEPLEDVVLARAQALEALTAVRGLPSRQRAALVATVFHGQRRSEVARAMGQSEGAVRQLVHRARVNVRDAVGAVVPYPLVRWLLALRGGSRAGAAELAGSCAPDSTVGVVGKLGAVLASGALATGIVAVPQWSRAPHPHAAAVKRAQAGGAPRIAVSPSRAASTSAGPARPALRVVLSPWSPAPRETTVPRDGHRGSGRGSGAPVSQRDGGPGGAQPSSGDGGSHSSGSARGGSGGSGGSRSGDAGTQSGGSGSDGGSGGGGGSSSDGGSGSGGAVSGGSSGSGSGAGAAAMVADGLATSGGGGGSSDGSSSGSSSGGSSDGGSTSASSTSTTSSSTTSTNGGG